MSKIRQLAGETVLYGLGNIVPRFINFFLIPIHTGIFNPEEFGVFTYLSSIVAFLNVIYSFGMETAFFRFATKPGADPNRVFNIALTAVGIISLCLSALFIVASDPVATLLGANGKGSFIIWLSIIMFIDNVVSIPFARLRLEKKPYQFAFYRITNVAILVGLNLYFLYVAYDPTVGIGYVFLSNLIANSLYLIFFLRTFLRWRPLLDAEIFPQMVSYSYPVVLTGLAAMTNQFFSIIWLKKWLPENFYEGKSSEFAVGVFGASLKLAALMNLAVQAFRMAAEPFFFSNASDKNSPQLFARVNHYSIVVCCFILLAIGINLDVLKYLIADPAYWEGMVVVVPLCLGYLFLGIYYNLTVWYKLTDRTIYGTFITAGGAILTIVLNFLLIPVAGYLGSSWATAIVYASMTVACYILGQKYYPIPYPVGKGLFYIATTTALVYLVNAYPFENLAVATGFHTLILTLWFLAAYLIERKEARQLAG